MARDAEATFHGNLTRDPELSYHKRDGRDVTLAKFSMAISNQKRNQDGSYTDLEPDYFDFVAWDREANHIAASLNKGDRALIVATPKQNRWTIEENGEEKNRSRVEFTVVLAGPSLQFAEVGPGGMVKTNGRNAETKTGSQQTDDF